jgi:hypothetical protein
MNTAGILLILSLAVSTVYSAETAVLRCLDPGAMGKSSVRSAVMVLEKPAGPTLYYEASEGSMLIYLLEVFDGQQWKRRGGFCGNGVKVLELAPETVKLSFGIMQPPPEGSRWRVSVMHWWADPGVQPDYARASKVTYEHPPKSNP